MAKNLQLVANNPPVTGAPPRPLGPHGMALWQSVNGQYQIEDAAGIEFLVTACQALDRAEALKTQIDADGAVIRTKAGLKDHPGLKHEIAARSLCIRTLARLGLDLEPLHSGPGRPAGAGYRS
ncbi:hypothetical protein EOA60_03085 [Mesorhizobium sp. M1A.F.Ca.IN.020.06.1.1]|uniref:hypothetical protein n=1 Tax=unclassified Mesorhizobium TaxID=325217 RepID=UPI000FCC617E|nr:MULTISPECIES: hypothetical protein [unclassified Mesorhizobium]RUU99680.1 hypothetical protein EOA79_21520 [Mesorhizobium sp. M1A.F.Ca.IN.020.03.2.1]RUV88182.1 hypothetical protein EOA51_08185 [Mesorhizobium sp. M1A.F.Ca.IN.020.32.1.1]RUW04538.1 hypothetical protein EOA46_30760 [Mesorhizobium sp. M1A.F.Ca.IN.022.05.2.1]RUW36241.1 hypothetical protein EOA60_03085 [Mesorhizobium sp. M1A.F.Ca.IN.020.06.1.1]RWF82371.1 MAG: hypothetical protein EOQ35_10495 [Mesorhizobium sp.]